MHVNMSRQMGRAELEASKVDKDGHYKATGISVDHPGYNAEHPTVKSLGSGANLGYTQFGQKVGRDDMKGSQGQEQHVMAAFHEEVATSLVLEGINVAGEYREGSVLVIEKRRMPAAVGKQTLLPRQLIEARVRFAIKCLSPPPVV